MRIIDISQEVLSCKVFPGDDSPKAELVKSMEEGELYNLSMLSMCAHNGTHVDAPFHFINEGKTVDKMPLEAYVGECFVARHEGDFTAEDAREILKKAEEAGAKERILIAGKATVTLEAAEVFAQAGIKLLGNESQTVGPENAPMAVHKVLLGKEIVLLEGVVLSEVSEGKYFLSAAPLNFAGFDGAPCRAYLIEKEWEKNMQTRKSSRAIVLNKQNEIFLFRYTFDFFAEEESIWITPGGGLDEGESFEEALKRELLEEMGIELTEQAPQIFYRNPLYELKNGETARCEERFYLVYCDDAEFSCSGWTESENKRMTAGKWWSLEKIRQSEETFFSKDILEILERLSKGEIPKEPEEIA